MESDRLPLAQIDHLIVTINAINLPPIPGQDKLQVLIDENAGEAVASLQVLLDETAESIVPIKAEIAHQLEKYSAWLILLEVPTDPTKLLKWVEKFITGYLTDLLKPALGYQLQMIQLVAKIAELTAAIANAEDRLKRQSKATHVTIPTLRIPTLL